MNKYVILEKSRKLHWWLAPLLLCFIFLILLVIIPNSDLFQKLTKIRPLYLYTDLLLFVLLAGLIFAVAYIRRTAHLCSAWARVFKNKVAMACSVVLVFYVLIAFIDSLHFQNALAQKNESSKIVFSHKVESVLDILLKPLLERQEKTYSAPFATHLFTKQNVEIGPGKIKRDYPKLKYGGQHLQEGESLFLDVVGKIIMAVFLSALIWMVFFIDIVLISSGHSPSVTKQRLIDIVKNKSNLPWKVTAITSLVLVVSFSVLYYLSLYYHVFGTNQVGKDTLYEALKSIRTGILIGTLATLIMLPLALFLGIAAGYFKRWIDDVIQFIYTVLSSIPFVLLIATGMLLINFSLDNNPNIKLTAEKVDLKLLALCAILGITSWTGLCRLLRGEALKIREIDYIQAAHAFGVSHWKVISSHILPNVMHIVMIVVVIDFSGLVLAEAVLSYIGIGVDPSLHSWGNMINSARLEMARDPMVWWSLVAAFAFMFTLVLAANLFADAVRDAFDPRLRRA